MIRNSSFTSINSHNRISRISQNSINVFYSNPTQNPINPQTDPFPENPPITTVDSYNILINLLPNIFNQLMHFLINIIFSHFIGSVNDISLLTGVNFGILYNNIFLYFFVFGLIQGMAVFCPNSFSQKNFPLIGIQTNQVRLMVLVIFIVFFIFTLLFGRSIICLISGEDTQFTYIAYDYVIYSEIGNFFEMFFEIHCKYCESQLFYKPIVHSLILSIIVNFLTCFLLIGYFRLGVIGAAMSFNITNLVKFIYIYFSVVIVNPYPQSNFWFDKKIFDWNIFVDVIRICFMSMLICYSEFFGYSLSNIFSVRLSELSYAKYIVVGNVYLITYPISLGVNNTITILTSYFYGGKEKDKIVKCIFLILLYATMINVPIWFIFIVFRKSITEFFSESREIYESYDLLRNFLINYATQIFDTLQNGLQGALRGLEILTIVSYSTFFIFLIYMPLGIYFLAFVIGFDVSGVFTAELTAYLVQFIILMYWLYYKVDLDKLCKGEEENKERKLLIEMENI